MPKLVLLRHGQSEFNRLNLFTGWLDVGLSSKGTAEATAAGKDLKDLKIDCIFTSMLIRAQQTAMLFMAESNNSPAIIATKTEYQQDSITVDIPDGYTPIIADWRLNERHYGKLQALNKQATIEKYGKEQVAIWRRSFDTPPPEGESLAMTLKRTIPAMQELILPQLTADKTVLVVAHGNSLRSIIMHIENIAEEDIVSLEIATAVPIIYNYDTASSLFTKL